jgi:hypothetical protein
MLSKRQDRRNLINIWCSSYNIQPIIHGSKTLTQLFDINDREALPKEGILIHTSFMAVSASLMHLLLNIIDFNNHKSRYNTSCSPGKGCYYWINLTDSQFFNFRRQVIKNTRSSIIYYTKICSK